MNSIFCLIGEYNITLTIHKSFCFINNEINFLSTTFANVFFVIT